MRQRPRVLHFTAEQFAEMAALYRHGWSCDQLAARFDCLSGSIQKRLRKLGVQMRPKKMWRHRASLRSNGYVMWGGKYVHRIVAEAWRGSPLQPGETVHHKDGDKTNNHPDNLEIYASHADHMRAETWRCKWTQEMDAVLIQRRAAGVTAAEIADELGLTKAGVDNRARDLLAAGRAQSRSAWRRRTA